ncbi:MAG: 1-(5-phosphoribosyl)-5-[(5-phosphoribosylamino)methylideneamino] imidazole-4-carboxamide isomerase [Thaumarchaeota archaeon]|nr:1-(5-phosphoribosyl)-5-[(5-phosphoribosylamino)methylideneamino] imidazole-4-carboxamide isomerase [Nitrososphaerota archaeon]
MDLLDSRVVRVEQGDERRLKVYSDNPVDTAESLVKKGASLIHVVDLNAAIHGDSSVNGRVVEDLLLRLGARARFQVAGGIRDEPLAASLIQLGAERIVLGSLAYSNPVKALSILKRIGSKKTVLALDYGLDGRVRTKGWKKAETESVDLAVNRFLRAGFSIFLLTAIQRDGMLAGPDFDTLVSIAKLKQNAAFDLIASGGVSTDEDLQKLSEIGIDEAIVGKAIYEGRLSSFEFGGKKQ